MTETTAGAAGPSAEEKRLRLAQLLAKKAAAPRVFPTSFLQQRLWFLDMLEPGSLIYNLSGAARITGPFDGEAMKRALNEVVRRHEALRTSIRPEGESGDPVQVVEPFRPIVPEMEDLSGIADEDARKEELERRLSAFVKQPFVLSEGPLFRVRLFREAPESHVLVLALHHIISDGWSIGMMVGELNTLYDAFKRGEPSPLPAPGLQYADFATWQRDHFRGGELARQLEFWRGQLAGAPAVLELPFDRPRPAKQDYSGGGVSCALGTELTARLKSLARAEGATPFMLLLAAFGVLLSRYSGQDDVVVGTPIAGRTRPELEGIFGYFANTLALRTDLSGDPTFRELLGRVRQVMLDAYAHQDFPFEKLVDELKVERSLSYNPLFQVLFALQNASSTEMEVSGAEVEGVSVDTGTTIFDMAWQITEKSDEYTAYVEYKTGLFDEDSVLRMGRAFRRLLHALADDPDAPVSTLDLVRDEDREKLLGAWTATARPFPADRRIHDLFAASVEKQPHAVAVSFADRALTYAELDAASNRLARHLVTLGVGPDVPVAISVERSPEMVVALLGVLKAGGAYLPVDPAYPRERRAYMLEDSGAPVLITLSTLAADLPEHAARVVLLDSDARAIDVLDSTPVDSAVTSDNLAYIIYTSGSTGRPKGVMVPHRGVVNLALAQVELFQITPDSRVLQFASFSFDAAVSEVVTALVAGARLHLAPQDALMPGPPLVETLREAEISVATLPPSVLTVLPTADFPALKTIVSAGEACPAEVPQRWAPGRRFVNAYGPTETTVCATASAAEDGSRKPTIGGAIANARAYVLDERLNLVPIGVPGELCVGGVGVARGYLRRPALTADRFVPDPFSDEPGSRLYRTGDRVRWLDDGTLEYIGRIDEQVKIRGFRIELGEIEGMLRSHPSVADVVVVARDVTPGDKRLVGYVVPATGETVDAAALRGWLKVHLPDYMVPSAIVSLAAFPLTPNGKVDRARLPAPDAAAGERASGFVAPRTPAEVAMAEIWAEVLGVTPVGIHDDFFELGGHSLLATRVVTRVRQALGADLPLRLLFESPTVAELCRHLERHETEAGEPALVPVPRDEPLPLSFAQERLWFVDRLIPGSSAYNMPVVVPVPGAALETIRAVLNEVARRHETLRTTFGAHGDSAVQVIAPPAPVPLAVMDFGALSDEERAVEIPRALSAEMNAPFDLERGPLFRATLVRASASEQVLLLVMHHAISDAWSVDVLSHEVKTLLAAFAAGEPSPLPELPIQYADFAVWQRKWLTGEVLERQVRYWKEQLTGAPATLELPTDRPRPSGQTFAGSMVPVHVKRQTLDALNAIARQQGATLFMVLLAAFDVVLSRWSGQDDVVVGSPIAGRSRTEVEGLIGFFVNNLVLRTDLSGEPSFRQLVARVKDVTLGAYAHQDVPFERLVEELGVERSMSHTPLFQVVFSLQNTAGAADAVGDGGGADAEIDTEADSPFAPTSSKFDLTLNLVETSAGLVGNLEFNTDIFEPATARRLGRHFAALAEAAVAQPDAPVGTLPMIGEQERATVLRTWNATERPYAAAPRIHDLFAASVAKQPDAVAVSFEGRTLTYAELDAASNRLARHLVTLGVGSDVPIAISVERSPEMVVALLAVLKAGGAYLPVDPAYPRERRAYMLEDSGAPVLLTTSTLAADLPEHAARVVLLDADAPAIDALDSAPVDSAVTADNLAYVIYTSGSTGRPKGVMVPHRGVVNLALAQIDLFQITPESRVLQFASFSFDAAVSEVVTALVAGARLHLAPQDALMPGPPLVETLREAEISVATLPPSVLTVLPTADFPALKTMVSAGEACPAEVPQRWAPGRRFVNAYGPTETTVCATASADEDGSCKPRIGGAIANARVYVLDERLNPMPIGVPGELCVGGVGVARGYLRRPELTADRFVPDPFSAEPGARLYRTGDRVRWLDDGTLEYIGRIDEQVKIRGFRIELGEVESMLRSHPSVADVVVAAREVAPGDVRLVGYVVPAEDQTADSAALRGWLKVHLPDYMVPSAIVSLPAFPLTPNGKVDRARLPLPASAGERASGFVAPRTPAEVAMAEIWAEVLGVTPVGIHDDFFELGGHSLLATRVVTRVRHALGADLPLRLLFESPTVAELCRHLERHEKEAGEPELVPVPRDEPLPLSFAQERLWFVDRLIPGSSAYNMPVMVPVPGAREEDVRAALNEVARRHETLRTTFGPRAGGGAVQVIAPPAPVPLAVLDFGPMSDAERATEIPRAISDEMNAPFDLERGPLFRATLVRASDAEQMLMLVMHHAIGDAWSVDVLSHEVRTLLAAFAAGEPSPLPPLPIQYADFAVWQRAWLTGEVLERQVRYWKDQLTGAPTLLELPADRPRPPVQTFAGSMVPVQVKRETLEALNALARREGATLFMVLLAAFDVVLSRWSGQEDVVVGSPIAGRNRTEVEGLIGFFVNNLVLRTDLSGEPSFRQLVGRVKEVTLGAYAHQDVPFERLVEELGVDRSLSHTPLFQVVFGLQNTSAATEAAGHHAGAEDDGEAEPSLTHTSSKFDLTLNVTETPAGLVGSLEFNTDIFDAATARRLGRHFAALAEAAVAQPDAPVSALPIIGEQERTTVLETWNATERAYPTSLRIHDLFEAQVRKTPHAPALVYGNDVLDYAGLNAWANHLAHFLVSRGIKPEARVAVCMERRPEMVAALLAVLKAGGAYVPVDPSYPAERMEYMLHDSGAAVVLTQAHVAPRLPKTAARIVAVDSAEVDDFAASEENPRTRATEKNAAYAIYTSGSTGKPKGVVIEHRQTVSILHWLKETVTDEERSCALGATSISFDVSIAEIFGTLCWGGKLVLVENALSLAQLGEDAGIRLATMVPSAAQELLRMGGVPSTVTTFNLGGEALPVALANDLYALGTVRRVLNLYGPTEDTTYSTWWQVEPGAERMLVGRPVANSQALVLDRGLQPVPVGVAGELYMAGDGVSRGYLNRPALTAERYLPNPHGPAGSRMYRVGDLARWRADGTLEYLGRVDRQVKIRGFRIEIGEIEAALAAHSAVRDVAVAVSEAGGDRRLVAYLVTHGGVPADVAEMRAYLKQHLPEFMVPSVFMTLPALPLTPNGKVDRRALPEPQVEQNQAAFVAAEGDMEEVLDGVWRDVLGLERVGVNDNFFELGGHSLLLARVQAELKERLGREVPMVDLFRFPTIRSLAAHLSGEEPDDGTTERGQSRADARRAARATRRGRR